MIIQCPSCHSMIEYDISDYEIIHYDGTKDDVIFLTCPVCGELIIDGTGDMI